MNRNLWRIFAVPTAVALASSIGLVAALVGDGILDALSWLGLGLPVALAGWYGLAVRRRDSPR